MSLQKRLTWLLTAFAGFGLVVTFGTIYAVRLHVEDAIAGLQSSLDDADWVYGVLLEAREQHVSLREIVDGLREADELYHAERDQFFDELRQVSQFTLAEHRASEARELAELTGRLRQHFEHCLLLARGGRIDAARALLRGPLEAELLPALDERLRQVLGALDDSRSRSVDELVGSNTQVLILSLVIGVFGVGLVAVGTTLVRRWIIAPVRRLSEATREFSGGNLDFRLRSQSQDELGALGRAMDQMAAGLADAQAEIRVSEEKHRSLFRNLRDATLVCDARGQVVECHDGDTNLLDKLAPDCSGRALREFWRRWQSELPDWSTLLERVLTRETQVRLSDLKMQLDGAGEETAIIDLIAYRVEFGHTPHVAIALRDVTERRKLEHQTRRAEAMEATVTFARGVAHDFNSLLTSAIGSLSQLSSEISDGRLASQLRRALRACGQAVGLSRALQGFAGGDRGNPEVLCLRETVELILDSLDEKFFAGIQVHTDLNESVRAEIDRDQFTQIVLNLIRNAREAMPDGGELHIKVAAARRSSSADSENRRSHALLTVSDAGCGITPEVRERLFEPFFTTKSPGSRRSRGLGLAVVYAAVNNANGLIEVEGDPGAGTTFRVYLPLWEQPSPGRPPPRDSSPEGARGIN
jgi:signal transduction histidine kinase